MLLSKAQWVHDLRLAGGVGADSTRAWYASAFRSLIEQLSDPPLDQITLEQLRHWRAALMSNGRSPWTVDGYIRAIKIAFRWLADEGYLDQDPAERLKRPRLPDPDPKAVSKEDLQLLLAAARITSARNYAIICVLADTGVRAGGLVGMKLGNLHLDRDPPSAVVWEKGGGGYGKARRVFFSPRTVEALELHLATRPKSRSDAVFLGRTRRPLTVSGLRQVIKTLAERAGCKGNVTTHGFRHGAAIGMLENGLDLGTVSRLLGHSGIAVTHKFYARWSDDQLADRHRDHSWLPDEDSA